MSEVVVLQRNENSPPLLRFKRHKKATIVKGLGALLQKDDVFREMILNNSTIFDHESII